MTAMADTPLEKGSGRLRDRALRLGLNESEVPEG